MGSDQQNEEEEELPVFKIGDSISHPITVEVKVREQLLAMEVDAGAAVSIISKATYQKLFSREQLTEPSIKLRTYTGEPMSVVGQMLVPVQYGSQRETLPLIVVGGNGPSLLGHDWLKSIRLEWKTIGLLDAGGAEVDVLLKRHKVVFSEELGTMKNFKAHLTVKDNATPVFHKPRTVPFAMKDSIEMEFERLEKEGIVERVSHSEWATPVVPVPKGDGRIRVCGDYKVTLNRHLEVDRYPLPKPNELFASLAGGQKFSKVYLTQAYLQMELDKESKKLTTLNTHQGLYRFNRLPFGISSAPALFQRAMDTILQGLPHVQCYIDDIIVTGVDDKEHLHNLEEVLQRLQDHNIRVKLSKCAFFKDSVEFLGHKITAAGVHTTPTKVEAIKNAPRPQNQQQLRSFLGLLHYYGKFIRNLSCLLQPLNALLQKGSAWKWSTDCENAFREAKERLTSAEVLCHYDPQLPLCLAGDASAYGIGAVISHTFPDGSERPVAYASRTLSSSERNYFQLEKEALSLVFGIRKFHQYVYGRHFTLYTDHQPLTTILGPKAGVPTLAAARLQRWVLLLSAHQYSLKFKTTKQHGNADGLSRLPIKGEEKASTESDATLFNVRQAEVLPVTAEVLKRCTLPRPIAEQGVVLHQTWLATGDSRCVETILEPKIGAVIGG